MRLLHRRPARRHHRLRSTASFDAVFAAADMQTITTAVRAPVMNAIQERWHRTVRAELLNRTLVWNLTHRRRVLAEYESFYNEHRLHRALDQTAPLRPLPDNVIDLDHFRVTRACSAAHRCHPLSPGRGLVAHGCVDGLARLI
jgi:transposase InsO family protein